MWNARDNLSFQIWSQCEQGGLLRLDGPDVPTVQSAWSEGRDEHTHNRINTKANYFKTFANMVNLSSKKCRMLQLRFTKKTKLQEKARADTGGLRKWFFLYVDVQYFPLQKYTHNCCSYTNLHQCGSLLKQKILWPASTSKKWECCFWKRFSMMARRCLMRQIRRLQNAGKLAAILKKTGRDDAELHLNCRSALVAGVHTNTEVDVRMLHKCFWGWFHLDYVEKRVQSVEFRCSWTAGPAAGSSPTTNTNIHSCKMAARSHGNQKIYIRSRARQQLAILSEQSFPGRGEVSSIIIETEQAWNEKKLPDKCKWGQISSHYCACRPFFLLAAKTKVCQRDYLGWLRGSWYNGWQQLSKFRSGIHIHHGGWQPSTARWAGNCKKVAQANLKMHLHPSAIHEWGCTGSPEHVIKGFSCGWEEVTRQQDTRVQS